MKSKLILSTFLMPLLLAGCNTNPIIAKSPVQTEVTLKTSATNSTQRNISSELKNAALVNNSSQSLPLLKSVEKIDSTGLVGKIITPKPAPKNSDISLISYENNYYYCGGGGVFGEIESNLNITLLRKDVKTKCNVNKITFALTKPSNNNKAHEFLDAIEVVIPKGYKLSFSGCTGATIALSKIEDKENYTKHLKAWRVMNNKFVAISNLNSISCENFGYGL